MNCFVTFTFYHIVILSVMYSLGSQHHHLTLDKAIVIEHSIYCYSKKWKIHLEITFDMVFKTIPKRTSLMSKYKKNTCYHIVNFEYNLFILLLYYYLS